MHFCGYLLPIFNTILSNTTYFLIVKVVVPGG